MSVERRPVRVPGSVCARASASVVTVLCDKDVALERLSPDFDMLSWFVSIDLLGIEKISKKMRRKAISNACN